MTQPADSIWTDEKIAQLKELWDEGVTTSEMGRVLGITKNAVIGKVHRLGLEPRFIVKLPDPPKTHLLAFLAMGPQDCRYPLWVGEPTFEYCGKPAQADSAYCTKHHQLCHEPEAMSRRRVALSASWTPARRQAARERLKARFNGEKRYAEDQAD